MSLTHAPSTHAPSTLALAGVALLGYTLLARRLRAVRHDVHRVETLGERVVETEQTILAALRGSGAEAENAAVRLLG